MTSAGLPAVFVDSDRKQHVTVRSADGRAGYFVVANPVQQLSERCRPATKISDVAFRQHVGTLRADCKETAGLWLKSVAVQQEMRVWSENNQATQDCGSDWHRICVYSFAVNQQ